MEVRIRKRKKYVVTVFIALKSGAVLVLCGYTEEVFWRNYREKLFLCFGAGVQFS